MSRAPKDGDAAANELGRDIVRAPGRGGVDLDSGYRYVRAIDAISVVRSAQYRRAQEAFAEERTGK